MTDYMTRHIRNVYAGQAVTGERYDELAAEFDQWLSERTPSREELSALILSFLKPPTFGGGSWTLNPDAAADAVLELLEGK